MKRFGDNYAIEFVVHWVVVVDQFYHVWAFGDEAAEEEMHFTALKALVVGIFMYGYLSFLIADPGVSISGQAMSDCR